MNDPAQMTQMPTQRPPKPAGPCTMVIFGAGGDLTKRLLVPALYNLSVGGLLPRNFALLGVDIQELTKEQWQERLRETMEGFIGNAQSESRIDHLDEAAWQRMADAMSYMRGDFSDAASFKQLDQRLHELSQKYGAGDNVLFYLAVADRFFGPVIDQLGAAGLLEEPEGARFWRRVVIEKPFGHDLASARALNQRILRRLSEHQIYRIDHFLGKETVQNITAFRFANGMFEPIWNRDRIDHVQITVAESVGVERRGRFYEQTGALRDMVPNHVFQLVAMVAMEPPAGFDARAIRDRKADVFTAMRDVVPADVVRGQYTAGTVLGQTVKAYREEPDVAPHSKIETYVAMRLAIDNWRWAGVPFYIRTGKHMSRRYTEIAIRFKHAPYAPFENTDVQSLPPNWIVLHIQPEEAIAAQFEVKRPGPVVELASARMVFRYRDVFQQVPNVGYETLIYDVMIGDQTLFNRADMVEATWRVVQPVLDAWAQNPADDPAFYASGTDGPKEADDLLRRDGREWRPVG